MKRLIEIFFVFWFFPLSLFSGQIVDNGKKIYEIDTKYFKVIFPEECKRTVSRLLNYADKEYERLANLFKVRYKERFTLVITPDIETVNGYFSIFPYNTIVLYDYMDNPTVLPFDDYFYNLFVHELTHAISLNLRNSFWQFLRNVLGSYVTPHGLQMPMWMIEGVTVSVESIEGDGRANAPGSKALLAQHKLEEKFQSLGKVSHYRPYYKKGNLHYIYGGLFNKYLIDKYGWEKYALLWYNNNRLVIPYTFYFSFGNIYGVSLSTEWENFSKEFVVDRVLSYNERKLATSVYIKNLLKFEDEIFYLDAEEGEIYQINSFNFKKKKVLTGVENFYVDEKSKKIYPVVYQVFEQTPKSIVKEYDPVKNCFTGKVFTNTSKLAFYKDKIVVTKVDRHTIHLAILSNGCESFILKGNESCFFDYPAFLEDGKLAFMYISSNQRKIVIQSDEGDFEMVKLPSSIWIEAMSVQGNKIYFNFYLKDRISLSRLGIIDFEKGRILLQDENVFGGIYNPVPAGKNLVYIKRLTEYDEIVIIENFEEKFKFITNSITTEKLLVFSENEAEFAGFNLKPYNSLPFYLPAFWLPFFIYLPLGDKDFQFMGFYTQSTDPLGENDFSLFFSTLGNPFNGSSEETIGFKWQNSTFPVNFSVSAGYDEVDFSPSTFLEFKMFRNFYFLSTRAILQLFAGANNLFNGEKWMTSVFFTGYGFSYNSLDRMPLYGNRFGNGFNVVYDYSKNEVRLTSYLYYNSGLFYVALSGGFSTLNSYGLGKNIDFWGSFNTLYDENKLSDKFLSLDSGFFLRLDVDSGLGLFPVFLNYLGVATGYRFLLTTLDYFSVFYSRTYIGSILGYSLPFNPFLEVGYFGNYNKYYYYFGANISF